ncbi:glycosyltransferase family 4 protein [Microbulbifer elongatus]|uniref:glycosyltransferase family 4 protein n=1 Tax=Microbulbifer elongatus TaxID=86173 RepID=UPI001CFD079E|nr:glycosyltransferase family 4 protein [Microbulbifer elongatus]
MTKNLNIWLPAVRAGSGADIYTIRLSQALNRRGANASITWFNHLYELAPFLIKKNIPKNTNLIIANSWNAFHFKHPSIPLICVAHHCVFDKILAPYKSVGQRMYHNTLLHKYEKESLIKSDKIVAVSHYTADSYRENFGTKDISVIHNWIDTNLFRPQPRKPSSKVTLAFTGNWSTRKGADLLPEIMQSLGDRFLLLTTAGKRNGKLAASLPTNIRSVGHLKSEVELVNFYNQSDILIYPSRLEGFGYSALEAHACGKPVVATNGSALPEVISHNHSGVLCEKDDVQEFVAAISDLGRNHELREEMGLNARKIAKSVFSEDTILDSYLQLLNSLI